MHGFYDILLALEIALQVLEVMTKT